MKKFLLGVLEPLFQWVDDSIYRFGYRQTAAGILGLVVAVFLASCALGVQVALTISLSLLLVISLVVGLSTAFASRNLREDQRQLARELAKYGSLLEGWNLESAIIFRSQEEYVTVSAKGDVHIVRTFTLGESSREIPHFVRAGFSADVDMSPHERRNVKVTASRVTSDGSNVRVLSTHIWTESANRHQMVEAHAYLDNVVREGDRVRFDVTWPGASARLRSGAASEPFTTFFRNRAFPVSCEVTFDGCESATIFPLAETKIDEKREGKKLIVRYASSEPYVGQTVGFTADMRN